MMGWMVTWRRCGKPMIFEETYFLVGSFYIPQKITNGCNLKMMGAGLENVYIAGFKGAFSCFGISVP